MTHPERIKALREDRDKRQADIAAILNRSREGYTHLETGDVRFTVNDIIKLSLYYKVSADYILGFTNKSRRAYEVSQNPVDFVLRLRELRKSNKKKQIEIAKVINKSQQGYAHLENGDARFSVDDLIALCQYYNISADYILGFTDEMRELPKDGNPFK